jgi:hypothetical protein
LGNLLKLGECQGLGLIAGSSPFFKKRDMEKTTELKLKIIERAEILTFFAREQLPFPLSAYKRLSNELKAWKIELAELENETTIMNYKQIKSN